MGSLRLVLAMLVLASPVAATAGPVDRWAPEIAGASERFGIPERWIRQVIRVESGGRTHLRGRPIVSSAGAMGLMQLMPATWADMRSRLGLGRDPHDPADNILAGTLYLRLMYDRFGYPGLFAAYNAGPARYSAALNGTQRLPSETRSYVAQLSVEEGAPEAGRRSAKQPPDRLFAVSAAEGREDPSGGLLARTSSLFVELGGNSH